MRVIVAKFPKLSWVKLKLYFHDIFIFSSDNVTLWKFSEHFCELSPYWQILQEIKQFLNSVCPLDFRILP